MSSKRSRSRSPEKSRSKSAQHRSKKQRHAKPHDRREEESNTSAALNALLDKITLISSSTENFNTRLSALESCQTQQTLLSNEHVQLEVDEQDHDDAAFCHRSYETGSVDQLSVYVPPDQDLEIVSPAILDTHDGHGDGATKSKSLDPVLNKISANVTTSTDVNNEENSPEEKETEKPRFFNPTAEAPSWDPSDSFKTFLDENFRRCLSSSQIFNILEETALPNMEVFTTPKLDKSLAGQISPSYKKTAENRDKELSKVQRNVLNAAAPLTVLHDLLENKETVSNENILHMVEKTLCLLGHASNSLAVLRRSKILYAINPAKISLPEASYPNAGSLLFGNDINKLAADSADISRNLNKNLSSCQLPFQSFNSDRNNFSKYHAKNEKFRSSSYGSNRFFRGAARGRFCPPDQGNRQTSQSQQQFRNNANSR